MRTGDARSLLALAPVIPVLTIEDPAEALPLARALAAGGLIVLEVTLRTARALAAIEAIARALPDVVVGAGTITKPADIIDARNAGARFLVSPGTPPRLAEALLEAGLPILPGSATVSEMMALQAMGFSTLKLFPAEPLGGVSFLKSVAGPLPDLVFCPTGGIDAAKAPGYLALKNVGAVGGSWVAPADALAGKDYRRIERLAAEAMMLRQ